MPCTCSALGVPKARGQESIAAFGLVTYRGACATRKMIGDDTFIGCVPMEELKKTHCGLGRSESGAQQYHCISSLFVVNYRLLRFYNFDFLNCHPRFGRYCWRLTHHPVPQAVLDTDAIPFGSVHGAPVYVVALRSGRAIGQYSPRRVQDSLEAACFVLNGKICWRKKFMLLVEYNRV